MLLCSKSVSEEARARARARARGTYGSCFKLLVLLWKEVVGRRVREGGGWWCCCGRER